MSYFLFVRRAAMLLLFMSVGLVLRAQTTPDSLPPLPKDANQLVRDAIKHQIEADAADHTHWRYHIHREDEKGSQARRLFDASLCR